MLNLCIILPLSFSNSIVVSYWCVIISIVWFYSHTISLQSGARQHSMRPFLYSIWPMMEPPGFFGRFLSFSFTNETVHKMYSNLRVNTHRTIRTIALALLAFPAKVKDFRPNAALNAFVLRKKIPPPHTLCGK